MKSRQSTWVYLVALAAALAGTANDLSAQAGNSSLVGTVRDTTGGVVPGVNITVVNEATNVSRAVVTNEVGHYEFPFLAPGNYTVRAELPGFATREVRSVALELRAVGRVDLVLRPAVEAAEVTVESRRALLTTDSAEISGVFGRAEVMELPLLTRNFASLQAQTPGTVPGVASGSNYGVTLSPGFIIGGGSYNATDYSIEGADNNNQYHFHNSISPSLEAIAEVKVLTGGVSADYGRGGSAVDVALKSGTNQYHGSIYQYHRQRALNARNAFARDRGAGFHRNQFGASLGGPVVKDRLFFFFSYEALRARNNLTIFEQVPTADQRAGRFTMAITDPLTGEPFPNNTIPPERITPYAEDLINLWPMPNEGSFFRGNGFSRQDWDQIDGKVDYILSERNSFAFSFGRREFNQRSRGNAGLQPSVIPFNFRRGALTWNYNVSPNLISSLQISAHRDTDQFSSEATMQGVDFWGQINANIPGYGLGYPWVLIQGPDFSGMVGEWAGPRCANKHDPSPD